MNQRVENAILSLDRGQTEDDFALAVSSYIISPRQRHKVGDLDVRKGPRAHHVLPSLLVLGEGLPYKEEVHGREEVLPTTLHQGKMALAAEVDNHLPTIPPPGRRPRLDLYMGVRRVGQQQHHGI